MEREPDVLLSLALPYRPDGRLGGRPRLFFAGHGITTEQAEAGINDIRPTLFKCRRER